MAFRRFRRRMRRGPRRGGKTFFWVGYTTAVNSGNVAPGTVTGFALLDPRGFEPNASAYGEDVEKGLTLIRARINWTGEYSTIVAGTASLADVYQGVYIGSTNVNRSPALSTTDDGRADWLDFWMEVVAGAAAIVSPLPRQAGGQATNERDIRTKRRLPMRFDRALMYSQVFFPHSGTITTGQLNMQLHVRLLLAKS